MSITKGIADGTEYHEAYPGQFGSKYRKDDLGALTKNHYPDDIALRND